MWGYDAASFGSRRSWLRLPALGSVRAVTKQMNGTWQVVARHDFMPFGEEVSPQNPPQDKRLFTGKERDTETRQDYFGARYYRADVGRFTTVDPEMTLDENLVDPQKWNRYVYARNNPLKHVDPDGRNPMLVARLMELAQRIANSPAAQRAAAWAQTQGVAAWNWGTRFFNSPAGQEALQAGVELLTGADARPGSPAGMEAGIVASAARGKAGEVLADIVKNTERTRSASGTAAYRIPDILDHANKAIGDVKNFSRPLSMSNQLRDFISYARENGYTLIRRVTDPSKVSKNLRTEIEELGGRIEPIRKGRSEHLWRPMTDNAAEKRRLPRTDVNWRR
jgi:RHS repeat-associated protein